MKKITNEIGDRLNYIGIELNELQRILKIIQIYIDYEDDVNSGDLEVICNILKSKITKVKSNFSTIQSELKI